MKEQPVDIKLALLLGCLGLLIRLLAVALLAVALLAVALLAVALLTVALLAVPLLAVALLGRVAIWLLATIRRLAHVLLLWNSSWRVTPTVGAILCPFLLNSRGER